jgi:hypothetical protein
MRRVLRSGKRVRWRSEFARLALLLSRRPRGLWQAEPHEKFASDTLEWSSRVARQSFSFGRYTPSLIVVEPKPSAAKLFL